MAYIEPKLDLEIFACPECNSNCQQRWIDLFEQVPVGHCYCEIDEQALKISECVINDCQNRILWLGDKIIYPRTTIIEQPLKDMPDETQKLYEEARNVFSDSPKSSAALLRLAIEKLCKNIKPKAKDLDNAIKLMVADGLEEKIQMSLDTLRVIGNNAVHPGQINLDDDADLAKSLFFLINYIVDKMIIEPKKIFSLYEKIPNSAKDKIKERDSK